MYYKLTLMPRLLLYIRFQDRRLHKKDFLDFWMYGICQATIWFLQWKSCEDADGDGIMDTEDKNSDGI